jgi:RNA polymerase sigma-70 factor (ECF subfamily)
LYALLVRLTLREDVADDLLQELVLRLSRSEGFQRAESPLGYARRAAIHLSFDWHRKRRHERNIEDPSEEQAAHAAGPLAVLIDREDYERVLAGIERLSPLGRTCVVLHYVEQLSYAEIAKQLGTTPHKVRGVCHKGVRRLQQFVGRTSNSAKTKGGNADER